MRLIYFLRGNIDMTGKHIHPEVLRIKRKWNVVFFMSHILIILAYVVACSDTPPLTDKQDQGTAINEISPTLSYLFRLNANTPTDTAGINLISLSEADNSNSHIALSVDQGGSGVDFYTLLPLNGTQAFLLDNTIGSQICEKRSERFRVGNIPNFVVGSEICVITPGKELVVKLIVIGMDLRQGWVDVVITIVE